jgi:cysteine desulfuration protein SufE
MGAKPNPHPVTNARNVSCVATVTACPARESASPRATYGWTSPREPTVTIVIFMDMDGEHTPPAIERVLARFRSLGREEKMQALVEWSRKLEPVPQRLLELDRAEFTVPECQTRVDLFPEMHDGRLHFYADLNARQSPTIAAVLAILFSAVNEQPPEVARAIPADFVRHLMADIGLSSREVGLNAMVARITRYAAKAAQQAA